MRTRAKALKKSLQILHLHSSTWHKIPAVSTIHERFDNVDIEEFRQRAFILEIPMLMSPKRDPEYSFSSPLPAGTNWFSVAPGKDANGTNSSQSLVLSHEYLKSFNTTILPYELVLDARQKPPEINSNDIRHQVPIEGVIGMQAALSRVVEAAPGATFHRFYAPLSLFLQACKEYPSVSQRLYIAQAQIADLPKQLQDDLPTPRLVKQAGKGDVYDSNIWMGIPPTYTPLHKDPNPNIFIQLASSKRVRLFRPNIGAHIFQDVQHRIGRSSSSTFRGEEMMEGPERDILEEAVWGPSASIEGFEAVVRPGDALFIPKGWWHSIKSIGPDITASVNWWFR